MPWLEGVDLECMDCHSDVELFMEKDGKEISVFVDESVLKRSAHEIFDCADCHEGFDGMETPHKEGSLAVDCLSCHEEADPDSHAFHLDFLKKPFAMTASTECLDCHGGHDTEEIDSEEFRFTRQNQMQSCGECHELEMEQFRDSAHGLGILSGMDTAPDCLECHKDPTILKNGDTLKARKAQLEQCKSCHLDEASVSERTRMGAQFIESYGHSVHGKELESGNPDAANCVDCHGSHEMNRLMVESSRVNKFHQAETCAACHEESAVAFNAGIHAQALRQGILDSPGCSDCHGEHNILFHDDPASPVSPHNVSKILCGECHGSVRLSQKYGISSDRFQTFSDSFHGLAVRGGAVEAVNCASCHGYHTILPTSD
ncbi:MAG: cytochrome B, partial [Verrucomicrobiae bacterium]|nr:cytochrome B [Verrucomicrobiae bacterium]